MVMLSITFEKGKSIAINDLMEHFNYSKLILGWYTKSRKATISFVVCLSVRPSVHPSVFPNRTTRLPLDRVS